MYDYNNNNSNNNNKPIFMQFKIKYFSKQNTKFDKVFF